MAYRRHLGEDQPSSPRTPACAPEEKGPKRDRKGTLSPARAWLIPSRSRAPGWAGKRGATMVARRSKRTQAPHPGGARAGRVALGGDVFWPEAPEWLCVSCAHERREEEEESRPLS